MAGDVLEVLISAEERQAVAHTEFRYERINCTDLDSGASARVAQRCSLDVVVPVRNQKRHSGKALENLCTCLRSGEALQQLLENESGSENSFASGKGLSQSGNMRACLRRVPPKRQRPHTGVDEQAHLRERSAL